MNNIKLLFLCLLCASGMQAWGHGGTKGQKQVQAATRSLTEVPFTAVHLSDHFWLPRIEVNRTVSIPSAFRECEKNGRFDNFALAATNLGHAHYNVKEHRGDFSFDDTDPYKVIEGASYSLSAHYDKRLDHYLDSVIAIIAAAQEDDGYLTTCVTNKCYRLSGWWGTHKWEKINSHELYNSGHLIEAAVAHYRATGKRSLLNVAIKNADLICQTFGEEEGKIHRPGGHPIIEMALCKLYKVTGQERYLKQARYFVEETGRGTDGHRLSEYSQDHMPILQQTEIKGHAVRAGYLYSGVADVAALTADTAYFQALERIWQNMSEKKLFITGGIGSRAQGEGFGPNYELNSHTAYCETCAAIANVYWNYRMFLATGEAKYMDIVERALYNNVLSGVSLSGNRFFYDNPLESGGEHERQAWFGCACCPGNITRFIPSVPGYVYAVEHKDHVVTDNESVFVNLFMSNTTELKVAGKKLILEQKTSYPWEGKVTVCVKKGGGRFAFKIRIPGWLSQRPLHNGLYYNQEIIFDGGPEWTAMVNGIELVGSHGEWLSTTSGLQPRMEKGYMVIDRQWKAGDEVVINFDMKVNRIAANSLAEDLRDKIALERGPIVYCLEASDQPDQTIFDKFVPYDSKIESHFEQEMLGGVVVLEGEAQKVNLLGKVEPVKFRAIPYSTWNNRGPQPMEVWVAANTTTAVPTPRPGKAASAKTFANRGPIQNDAPETAPVDAWAGGVNDQWEPKRSSDTSKPYHYWWLKRGTQEAISYQWEKEQLVGEVQVYWLDFDHYDGNFRVPESWALYYKTADGEWREVEDHEPYTVLKDCYNSVRFKRVKTTALKIVVKLQDGQSGGVLEWKVN